MHTVQALTSVLESEQTKNAIPAGQRIRITQINAPARPIKTAGRSHTASILALLLCVLGAVALAHLLAALRDGREDMESIDGVVVPWGVGDLSDTPDMEPMPAGGRRFCAGPDRLALRQAPGTVSSRVAVLPAPGPPGAAGGARTRERALWIIVGPGGAGCARRRRRSRPGQPDPRRGRACRWCSSPTAARCSRGRPCSAC